MDALLIYLQLVEGNIGQANYAATKAGVVGLTKTATKEVGSFGITCNAICPGFMDTDMTKTIPDKVKEKMVGAIPVGRIGTPKILRTRRPFSIRIRILYYR